MGLIKAALGAAGGVLADQWKEYFYCESLPLDVIVTKGKKKVSGRSSNTKGDDNIISINGDEFRLWHPKAQEIFSCLQTKPFREIKDYRFLHHR